MLFRASDSLTAPPTGTAGGTVCLNTFSEAAINLVDKRIKDAAVEASVSSAKS